MDPPDRDDRILAAAAFARYDTLPAWAAAVSALPAGAERDGG